MSNSPNPEEGCKLRVSKEAGVLAERKACGITGFQVGGGR